LVSARLVIVELLDGGQLELAAGAGELTDGVLRRVPLADTVASVALRTGQTQRLSEAANLTAFTQHRLEGELEAGIDRIVHSE
jgi:hypothetical protein